jgi:hypothetical protein
MPCSVDVKDIRKRCITLSVKLCRELSTAVQDAKECEPYFPDSHLYISPACVFALLSPIVPASQDRIARYDSSVNSRLLQSRSNRLSG